MTFTVKPIIRAIQYVAATAIPAVAFAQQATESESSIGALGAPGNPGVMVLPTLDIRSVVATTVDNMPGAASVLTKDEIDLYKPYTLHDALGFVPGVRTIDDDILGRRSGIGVRGAPPRRSRKILLLEDGVPINNSAYLDSSAHYTPPLERLERVEVYKGAGQIIHGPLNNHGIINFRNLTPTERPETVIEAGVGNQDTLQTHVHHRRTEGDVGMVFSYTRKEADGAFDVEETKYDDLYAAFEWQVNDTHQLALSATYLRERSDGYDENNLSLDEYREAPRDKSRFNEGRRFNNISVNYLKLDLSHTVQVSDQLSVASKFFTSDLERPRFRTNGTDPREGGFMAGRDRRYDIYGGESRVSYDFDAFGLDQQVQTGVRYEKHEFDDRRPVGAVGEILNEGNRGFLFATDDSPLYETNGRLTEYQAEAVSGFVQNAMSFGDWTVTPGLRFETFNQYRDTVFRPGSSSEGTRQKDSNDLWLPGISFLYEGFENSEVYAGIHRGYSPASARSEDFPLTPETGVNSQIGFRTSAVKGMSIDLALFHNRIKDTLIRENDPDPFGDGIFINAADSEITGIDLGARIDSYAFFESNYNLFAEVALNYTDAEFSDGPLDGNQVPEIPKEAGSLTFGADHSAGWHLSATVSHLGAFYSDIQNTRDITADGEAGEVPSRTLWSARASYVLPTPTETTLWLQGRNLTDKLYITDVQDGIRPGAERTVVGGVTVRF